MIALFYIGVVLVSAGVVSMITSIVNEFLPYDDSKLKRISSTILAKYAKMAKAGACQKMEKPAVVVEEW